MGGEDLCGSNPASARTLECRPSAATVSRGAHLVPAVFQVVVTHAGHCPVLLDQSLHRRAHYELERRIASSLGGQKFEEPGLPKNHDVGELGADARKSAMGRSPSAVRRRITRILVCGRAWSFSDSPSASMASRVDGWTRVAAEIALEVAVRFQQRHRHAGPSEQV